MDIHIAWYLYWGLGRQPEKEKHIELINSNTINQDNKIGWRGEYRFNLYH